ncbi:hypothetical protein FQZ97_932030 [compost metagenome]
MPAVRAMAKAPQKVTRTVAFTTFAPPALAPIAPSKERNSSDAAETSSTSCFAGASHTMASGIIAPTAKVRADVRAATIGLAVEISEMPSSSRACASSGSFCINCSATRRAKAISTPRLA